MSTTFHLTKRDKEIAQALAQKVRLFSQRQIADHWWNGEITNARRRLKRLAHCGLVARITVQARPVPLLESPLVIWEPGHAAPDPSQIAYRCQQRWRKRPSRPCAAWIATERAAQLFGGVCRGELKHALQATHDLGVAAVWLHLRQDSPDWAEAWRSEDLLAHTRRGEKLPDAFIVDHNEKVICVIEFGGGYDTERVQAFHEDCVRRGIPYELW